MSPVLPVARSRPIQGTVAGVATSDGAGVRLTRVLTQSLQRRLDPFLMLDAFATENPGDYIGGFPDHPHRGFETVTYMIAGQLRHQDSLGNSGVLGPAGVQWMCAGRGIIHSEMPEQHEGLMEGFQLWINLPAGHKMSEPWYRDLAAGDIPEFTTDEGARVRVIAGSSHGVAGAIERPHTQPLYLDVHLPQGGRFEQRIDPRANALIYVYRGAVEVGGQTIGVRRMGILGNDAGADGVVMRAPEAARVLLIAGMPLGEPIAQYGPFVMNTHDELRQAIDDMRTGRLGR